jgi:two-component system cell cycle response regulator
MTAALTSTEPPALPAILSRESLRTLLYRLELTTADDFRGVAGPAEQVLRLARENDWTDLGKRAELVLGDVRGRFGDLGVMGRTAKSINLWAVDHQDRYLMARTHRLLAMFYRRLGDSAEALANAVPCVEYADVMPDLIRCGHLITLALTLDVNGSYAEANRYFVEALDIATTHHDPGLALATLNNMAFTAYENGDIDAATDLVERMREVARRYAKPLDGLHLDTIARISMMRGRFDEAERVLQPVLDDPGGPLVTEADSLPECLLTAAAAQAGAGAVDRARRSLDEAGRLAEERGLAGVTARVHEARAEQYAAGDDYRNAYREYRLFHEAREALHSAQREVRAQAVQAVYETTEARRSSERFRQLALRDQLTGLYNRRHVDERLAALVTDAGRDGTPLSLALLDLDHFKRINDTLSHGVGDQVLQQVAVLLEAGGPARRRGVRADPARFRPGRRGGPLRGGGGRDPGASVGDADRWSAGHDQHRGHRLHRHRLHRRAGHRVHPAVTGGPAPLRGQGCRPGPCRRRPLRC